MFVIFLLIFIVCLLFLLFYTINYAASRLFIQEYRLQGKPHPRVIQRAAGGRPQNQWDPFAKQLRLGKCEESLRLHLHHV